MIKVIFLDVDGVINTNRIDPNSDNGIENEGFNTQFILNLKRVVEKTGAAIVVSSDWRLNPDSFLSLLDTLSTFDIKNIIGKTGEVKRETLEESRAEEILQFIKNKKNICDFIVIDDMNMEKFFGDRMIHCKNGLTEEETTKALKAFKNDIEI